VVFESVPGGQFSSQLDRAMSKIPNVGAVGQVRAHTEAGLHTSPSSMTTLGGHIGENLADANLSGGINRNTSPAGGGVRVESIQVDERPGPLMYDPSHPHANEAGYVEMPNVNIVTEMVNMMAASRAYEANITSLNTTRTLISRTLEIGQSR
jgi:flagellar basal-body rod protein FlgC